MENKNTGIYILEDRFSTVLALSVERCHVDAALAAVLAECPDNDLGYKIAQGVGTGSATAEYISIAVDRGFADPPTKES